MNAKPSNWFLIAIMFVLSACMDQGSPVTVNITQPVQLQVTNGTLDVRLELSGSTPDALSSLTVILERRKSADPDVDASYLNFKTFLKGDPYPFAYTWDTAGVPDGEYALRARLTYTRGGFDGQPRTTSSASRTVTIDRSRLSVASSSPVPGAKNASVRDPITVTFNKPVLVSSLTDDSLKLFSGGVALGRTVKLSSDGKTLTVTPVTQPKTPNTLRLELSESVTDMTGNKLIPKAWSWIAPAWVRLGDVRSSVPGVPNARTASFDIAPDGNPILAWRGGEVGDYSQLYVSRWNGSTWVPLGGNLRMLKRNATDVFAFTLQADSNGNPVVAWKGALDNAPADVFVHRWDETSWQELGNGLRASRSGATSIGPGSPGLAIGSDNLPRVGWEASLGQSGGQAAVVSGWDGTAWRVLGGDLNLLVPNMAIAESPFPFLI